MADRTINLVARGLFHAFEQRRWLVDASPWPSGRAGRDRGSAGVRLARHGLDANRAMIQTFCDEERAQGLIDRPIDPNVLFAGAERAIEG